MTEKPSQSSAITSRRSFVKTSAVAGALITSKTKAFAQQGPASKQLNVALIGCGAQGVKQVESIIGYIDGINFVAVCDIWENYSLKNMWRRLKRQGFDLRQYTDYKEMLDKETELDAVFIASPDYMHHIHTRACLERGLPVYCEKMMSNTIEGARDMVKAQREFANNESRGILQIGHQRRSNPRYLALRNKLIHGAEAFGRITHASAQWNRGTSTGKLSLGKERIWVPEEILIANGYGEAGMPHQKMMDLFRNWRLFSKYGGGVISDLGAHQIDVFNWVFDSTPKSVVASGGVDYYEDSELADNVMCVYDYDTPKGTSRAYYQVLTTTSSLGFFERFLGDQGSVEISELPKTNQAYREANAEKDWDALVAEGLMTRDLDEIKYKPWQVPKRWGSPAKSWMKSTKPGEADSRASKELEAWELSTVLDEKPHTPHLRNFIDVVRGDQKELNCTVQEAYKTCVTVLKIYEAMETGSKVEFSPSDFEVA